MTKLLPLAVLLATTATLHADSLEERKYWKLQSERIQRSVDAGEKVCGVKFAFEFVDKPGFREAVEKEKSAPYNVCDRVVLLVNSLCRAGDDEKQSVAAKIKTIKCGYSNPWTLDLKGGALTFNGNNTQYNFDDWAKPLLMKKL